MKIAKMSDVYLADKRLAEVVSKSLAEFTDATYTQSSESGTTGASAAIGTTTTSHDNDKGPQSKEPATASAQTKATADASSPAAAAADTQDSATTNKSLLRRLACTRMLPRLLLRLPVD